MRRRRQAGKLAERVFEQCALARQQPAQQQRDGQRAALAQMTRKGAHFLRPARPGDANRALLARLPRDAARPFGAHPRAAGDEIGQRLGGRRDEIATQRRGQPRARQQRLARFRVVAEAFDDAPHHARAQLGLVIAGERDHRLALADFRERRRDADVQARAAGQHRLGARVADRRAIDQFGVGQHRRARQHHRGNLGLVAGERQNDMMGRVMGAGQRLGERAPHQRGRVVEQRGQTEFRLAAQRGAEVGIEKGARQRARRLGPAAGVRPLRPGEKAPHNAQFVRAWRSGLLAVANQPIHCAPRASRRKS